MRRESKHWISEFSCEIVNSEQSCSKHSCGVWNTNPTYINVWLLDEKVLKMWKGTDGKETADLTVDQEVEDLLKDGNDVSTVEADVRTAIPTDPSGNKNSSSVINTASSQEMKLLTQFSYTAEFDKTDIARQSWLYRGEKRKRQKLTATHDQRGRHTSRTIPAKKHHSMNDHDEGNAYNECDELMKSLLVTMETLLWRNFKKSTSLEIQSAMAYNHHSLRKSSTRCFACSKMADKAVKDKMEAQDRPENCQHVKTTRRNTTIWRKLHARAYYS
jgi:hypothetical protein